MRRARDLTLRQYCANLISDEKTIAEAMGHTIAWSIRADEDGYISLAFACIDCRDTWRYTCGSVSVDGAVDVFEVDTHLHATTSVSEGSASAGVTPSDTAIEERDEPCEDEGQ